MYFLVLVQTFPDPDVFEASMATLPLTLQVWPHAGNTSWGSSWKVICLHPWFLNHTTHYNVL